MASAEIALVWFECLVGLYQARLCVNSDADETLA